jgi:hypothetical protein
MRSALEQKRILAEPIKKDLLESTRFRFEKIQWQSGSCETRNG